MIVIVLLFWLFQYDPFGNSEPLVSNEEYDPYLLPPTRRSSTWARRFRIACCFVGSEGSSATIKDAFQEMGSKGLLLTVTLSP